MKTYKATVTYIKNENVDLTVEYELEAPSKIQAEFLASLKWRHAKIDIQEKSDSTINSRVI